MDAISFDPDVRFDSEIRPLNAYATLEYILLGDLQELLGEPLDEQNRTWLRAILHALLETLPREFSLQEAGGYLTEVLDRHPNWATQIETLREQRSRLYARLEELHDQVVQRGSLARTARELRRELREWIAGFQAHHRHERRLLQNAFNTDVGGSG